MLLPCLELTFIAHYSLWHKFSSSEYPQLIACTLHKAQEPSSPIYSLLDIGAWLCKYKLFFLSSTSPSLFDAKVGLSPEKLICLLHLKHLPGWIWLEKWCKSNLTWKCSAVITTLSNFDPERQRCARLDPNYSKEQSQQAFLILHETE